MIIPISHQPAHLRRALPYLPNQNPLITTYLSELCKYGPCPLGDYNLKPANLAQQQRDIVNIDKDEECIFCKPHYHQTEQFAVITDLSRILISDPKAPLSGVLFSISLAIQSPEVSFFILTVQSSSTTKGKDCNPDTLKIAFLPSESQTQIYDSFTIWFFALKVQHSITTARSNT